MVDPKRLFVFNARKPGPGPVVYWMQRDQRADDNWALLHAQEQALGTGQPLAVVFCLAPAFLGASDSHFRFMLGGLRETRARLAERNIPLLMLEGEADKILPSFLELNKCGLLVTDFNPVNIVKRWKKNIVATCNVAITEVDAHNIFPCREISPKAEFGAVHLRNRIGKRFGEFMTGIPDLKRMPGENLQTRWAYPGGESHVDLAEPKLNPGEDAGEPFKPGTAAALNHLRDFLDNRLSAYATARNDPSLEGQSGLSPWLHFGQISAQRIALTVRNLEGDAESRHALLEELIVRRELADNFCHYNENYDAFEGFHPWAKTTLNHHRHDAREYLYTPEQFRDAATHDSLWNAAQKELVVTGKMHGFMRMYWAKKILEWTASPEEAMAIAIHLNDRYSLDGRDPNGYAGIAWSIGGVHDRAWGERPVYGKIRYMNENGCRRKFDVATYIKQQGLL
jgi:deoxyribodipyrimidine photo-lyase